MSESPAVPTEPENLREYYITPDYLTQMRLRAREWTDEFIQLQMNYFRRTIPDYPEVAETLEGELYARTLNRLKRAARSRSLAEVKAMLKKYGAEADYREVLEAELEIRSGVRRLTDRTEGRGARISE
jgi:hypothetical protein